MSNEKKMCDCNQGRLPCTCRPMVEMVSVPCEHLERLVSHAEDEIEHAGTDLQAVVASVRQSMAQHHGEPVAWMYTRPEVEWFQLYAEKQEHGGRKETPLYTHPAPAGTAEVESLKSDKQAFAQNAVDLRAEVERLRKLSVTNILIDIVPGDGSGHEVYAHSVQDVEDKLGQMGDRIELLESGFNPAEGERLREQANDWAAKWEKAIRAGASLERKLAEAHALLKRQPSFIHALEQFEADDGTFVRLSDVLGALSASAEPEVKS